MMSTPYSRDARRGGFTLVEVAIALALFVIGALAIVRIFPPALNVIRNNENRVTATQMGETTLSLYKNKYSQPPEAVFDVNVTGSWVNATTSWQDYPAAIVGSLSRNSSLPKGPTEPEISASALGRFRYIYGEPHYIGSSQFILLNQPRASRLSDDTTLPVIPVEAFVDETVEGVQISSGGYLDFSNAYLSSSPGTAFNDTTNPTRPPDTYRRDDGVKYYVSYRWRECTNSPACTIYSAVKGVLEEPLSIPDNGAGYNTSTNSRVLATTINSLNRVLAGDVRVRLRRTVTATPITTGDPQNAIVSISASSAGTYYVSYLSSDWRSLVDNSTPAAKSGAASTGIVKLPLGNLDDSFGTTGVSSGVLTRSDQSASASTLTPTNIDKKKGEIEYTINTWNGPRVRTIYRALNGWAHQLSVAPRAYYHYDVNRTGDDFPREQWREYHWSSTDPTAIYFHPAEAGKTVALSFIDNTGATVNSVCTVEDNLIDQPSSVAAGFMGSYLDPTTNTTKTNTKVARLFITNAVGANATASSILGLQGLSIRARSAWLFNDKYNQVIVPGFRTLTEMGQ